MSDRPDEASPLEALAAVIPPGAGAWIVGGAVRDALLERPHPDYDLAVAGDARRMARELARATGGFSFSLSDAWGAWRVIASDRSWQVDLTPLTGETLEHDLRRRDLTVNAIAQPLCAGVSVGSGDLIDPCGGLEDLRRRSLRAVGPESFRADPLRIVRLARLAAELDFEPDPETSALARSSVRSLGDVAPERVFAELRLLICSDRAVAGLELLRQTGATAALLPELEALRELEQSPYHHLDVYEHTLATLQATIDLERSLGEVFGEHGEAVARVLAEPLANQLTRGQALRFGALLHDIAKPRTRALNEQGWVTFFNHDVQGAAIATEMLTRLRASERLTAHVAALARNHLRLGFLVHEQPLSPRTLYGYLAACEPVEVDVTVLSVADRMATLGRNAERAVPLHLELAAEIIDAALAWHRYRPKPPIRGDVLARALGIVPGPELGPLLAELTEAAYAGEIDGEEQAVEHARAWLAAQRREDR